MYLRRSLALSILISAVCFSPAGSQIPGISLPAGEALPSSWTAAAPLYPVPEKWAAQVSWAITSPSTGLYTYWYKIDHLGAGPLTPAGAAPQSIKSIATGVDPQLLQTVGGVYQFGYYEESPPNRAGQSFSANLVYADDCKIDWSNYYLGTPLNSVTSGETVYLWMRSESAPAISEQIISLQDGSIGETLVPLPGFCGQGNICGKAYCDDNGNGIHDADEPGIADVVMVILRPDGTELGTIPTDADGGFCLNGLNRGDYRIVAPVTSDGLKLASAPELSVNVQPYQTVTVEFPYRGGLVDGYAFCDENGDRIRDANEAGIAGVTIKLSDGSITTTDANGYYVFQGCLSAGGYTITAPQSFAGKNLVTAAALHLAISEGESIHDHNFAYDCKPPACLVTYTQGGWGAKPSGKNPGMLLALNFSRVFGSAGVKIGGTLALKFTTAKAIEAFLPQGGTPGVLKANACNPTKSAAGVFAGQVLALHLSVSMSNAGVTPWGLGNARIACGSLAGRTVNEVLALANAVLGGEVSALPRGMTLSNLSDIVTMINENYDNGSDRGFLKSF